MSLGQAFVRFQEKYDRDRFVLGSPHVFGDVHISFARHKRGRNWRKVSFNYECWLMLMGLTEDYWEDEHIEVILGPFARTVSWKKTHDELAFFRIGGIPQFPLDSTEIQQFIQDCCSEKTR